MFLNEQEQAQYDDFMKNPYWPEPDFIIAIDKRKDIAKEEEIESLFNVMKDTPYEGVILPGDFKNSKEQLLGKEIYQAYYTALDFVKAKWLGYDYQAFESVALIKAYELREQSPAFVRKSVRNALHDEVKRQARVRSHEFNVDGDNYSLANQVVNEIDRALHEINEESKGERRPMEYDMRNNKATRFSTAHLNDYMDTEYEFTEWEQIRETLVMYLAFPAGLPLSLMLEIEHLFSNLTLKQKSALIAYANRTNNRNDEKIIERICKAYLSSLTKEV